MLKSKHPVYIFRLFFPTQLIVQMSAFCALHMHHKIYLDCNINIPALLGSQNVVVKRMRENSASSIGQIKDLLLGLKQNHHRISDIQQHDPIFKKQIYFRGIVDSDKTDMLKCIPLEADAREERAGTIWNYSFKPEVQWHLVNQLIPQP